MVFNPTIPGWSDSLPLSNKNQLLMLNWASIQAFLQKVTQKPTMDGITV
jgi:hypothetical protein